MHFFIAAHSPKTWVNFENALDYFEAAFAIIWDSEPGTFPYDSQIHEYRRLQTLADRLERSGRTVQNVSRNCQESRQVLVRLVGSEFASSSSESGPGLEELSRLLQCDELKAMASHENDVSRRSHRLSRCRIARPIGQVDLSIPVILGRGRVCRPRTPTPGPPRSSPPFAKIVPSSASPVPWCQRRSAYLGGRCQIRGLGGAVGGTPRGVPHDRRPSDGARPANCRDVSGQCSRPSRPERSLHSDQKDCLPKP